MANTTCSHDSAQSVCSALWHSIAQKQHRPDHHSEPRLITGAGCWRLFGARGRQPVVLFSGMADNHYRCTLDTTLDALLFWFVIEGEVTLSTARLSSLRMTGHSANLIRLSRCSAEMCIRATTHTAIALLEIPTVRLSELLTADEYEQLASQLFVRDTGALMLKQQMTADMYSAVQSLVGESFPPSLRDFFVAGRADELIARFLKSQLSLEHTLNDIDMPSDFTVRIQQARQILLDNYLAPPTLEQLARKVGINRNKLCRGFRQLFGSTVFEFCHRHRMQMARTLLRENNFSIAHVAEATGYEHPGNFTVAYKRHYGELPKAAKQQNRMQSN